MRLSKRMTMVLALLLSVIGADVCAQEVADSVWVDSVEVDSVALAEEFKSDYDSEVVKARKDSCLQARYVIVSMNGKYGIYDREKNDSVTAVDMDYIEYSHYFQPEDGLSFCYFYYEKGVEYGKLGVNMADNSTVKMSGVNPRLVAMEDDFPTLDSLVSARCRDVLAECMKDIDGMQGQIAVVDAQTQRLLSWCTLERAADDVSPAPLLKKFCSAELMMPFLAAMSLARSGTSMADSVDTGQGILELNDSVRIRDHNWRRGGYGMLTFRQALLNKSRIGMYRAMMTLPDGEDFWKFATDQTKNTNAMELAQAFNALYHIPSDDMPALCREYIRAIAVGMFKKGGIQHRRAPKKVKLAGVYNVADDGTEQTFAFVGCFPARKPKYAVSMVVLRKHKLPASPAMVSDKVNALIEFLNKK